MAKSPFYTVIIAATGRDISGIVSRFSWTEDTEADDILELQLIDTTLALVDDPDLVQGKELKFHFGWLGGEQSAVHLVEIANVDVNYGKRVDITLKCTDKGEALKKGESKKLWEGQTASQMAEAIAKVHGLKTNIDATAKVYESLPQGNRTDFEFLRYLTTIEDKGEYHFFVAGGTLNFKRRTLSQSSRGIYTYGDPSGVVLSFRPQSKTTGNKTASTQTSTVGINPATNEPFGADANNDTQGTALGEAMVAYNRNAVEVGRTEATGKTVNTPTGDEEEAVNTATKLKRDAELKDLTATLKVEMDPRAKCDSVITMAGVAQRHIGNWYVAKCTTDINSGPATTTIHLQKNATKKALKDDADGATDVNKSIGNNATPDTVDVLVYDGNSNQVSD